MSGHIIVKGGLKGILVLILFCATLVALAYYLGPSFKYVWLSLIGFLDLVIIVFAIIAIVAITKALGSHGVFGDKGFAGGGGITDKIIGHMKLHLHNGVAKHKRTIDISSNEFDTSSFHIETVNGNIDISGVEGKKAEGTIEIYESEPDDVTASFENNTIKLTSKKGKDSLLGNVKISIPKNTDDLKFGTTSGDIAVKDFKDSNVISLKAISGDIEIENCKEITHMELKIVSGDVSMEESSISNVTHTSVSGDFRAKDSTIEVLTAKTVSGDIDYKTSKISKTAIRTVSGTISK